MWRFASQHKQVCWILGCPEMGLWQISHLPTQVSSLRPPAGGRFLISRLRALGGTSRSRDLDCIRRRSLPLPKGARLRNLAGGCLKRKEARRRAPRPAAAGSSHFRNDFQ